MRSKYIEQFLQGKFELNCPKIKLTPCDTDGKKPTLNGSGFISIDDDDNENFYLKVLFPTSFDSSEVLEQLNWEAGKVIGDEFYYKLTAFDMTGNKWCAEKFIPNKSSGPGGSIITGKIPELNEIRETRKSTGKYYVHLCFNEIIKVPLNTLVREQKTVEDKIHKLNAGIKLSKFSACGIDFEIDETEGYTLLTAATNTELSDIQINRIFEAFRFITAYTESWSMLVTERSNTIKTRIRVVKGNKIKSRTPPPISFQRIHSDNKNNTVWILFEAYLNYVFSNNNDLYHPVSTLYYEILNAGKASLGTEALVLSVAIESIINKELTDLYKVDHTFKKNIKCVSQLVKESDALNDDFKKRVLGSISVMKKPRAKDILLVLCDKNIIDKNIVDIYNKLRNKSAHGVIEPRVDIQNYINEIGAALVLFYKLIFLIIKYNGKYTNYGFYKYPEEEFDVDIELLTTNN